MNKQTEIKKELAQLPILEYAFLKPGEIIFSKKSGIFVKAIVAACIINPGPARRQWAVWRAVWKNVMDMIRPCFLPQPPQ